MHHCNTLKKYLYIVIQYNFTKVSQVKIHKRDLT